MVPFSPATKLTAATLLLVLSIFLIIAVWCQRSISTHFILGWRNPILIPAGYLIIVYCLRPLYVLLTGGFGTSPFLARYTLSEIFPTYRTTLILILFCVIIFTVTFQFAPQPIFKSALLAPRKLRPRANVILFLTMAFSCATAAQVVRLLTRYDGTWQQALQARKFFYSGATFYIVFMTLFQWAFIVWFAFWIAERNHPGALRWVLPLSLWLITLFLGILTGGRANLILFNLLPLFFILSHMYRRSKAALFSGPIGFAVAILVFIGYRTVVRDGAYNSIGRSATDQFFDRVLHLPTFLLGSYEADIFDGFVLINKFVPSQLPHRGLVPTIQMILAALIPSRIYTHKPVRTGELLTSLLDPVRASHGANYAFSGIGDLYFGTGMLGLFVGVALLGGTAGTLIKSGMAGALLQPGSAWPLAFAVLSAGHIVMVLRSDLFYLSFLVMHLGLILAFCYLLTAPAKRSETGDSQ